MIEPRYVGSTSVRPVASAGARKRRLSPRQRTLAAAHLGLVTVHLRRFVPNLNTIRRDREWDDLFQEGCLGLMQAAADYRLEHGIPFPAFAMPRIRNAVSRALQSQFSTNCAPCKSERSYTTDSDHDIGDLDMSPTVSKLGVGAGNLSPGRCRNRQGDQSYIPVETIGERLRGKYERALRDACETISRLTSKRGDRVKLVRVLKDERLLVPHEEDRRALRQIARDTRSSFSRVAKCEKQIGRLVRATLAADPEFCQLKRLARTAGAGPDSPIDTQLELDLARISANEFVRRFCKGDPNVRARLLDRWLSLSGLDVTDVGRAGVLRLSALDRERLLRRPDINDAKPVRRRRGGRCVNRRSPETPGRG